MSQPREYLAGITPAEQAVIKEAEDEQEYVDTGAWFSRTLQGDVPLCQCRWEYVALRIQFLLGFGAKVARLKEENRALRKDLAAYRKTLVRWQIAIPHSSSESVKLSAR